MIYQTGYGHYCNPIFLAERVHQDVMQEITGNLSMLLFGFYVLVRHGAICLHGDWKNTHRRFCRWRDKGVWEKLFNLFVQDPGFEWLMINASYIKVHPHATIAFPIIMKNIHNDDTNPTRH